MPALAALILAAGGSTRMGQSKQLLKFEGKTLLRRTIEVAEKSGCDPIFVVIGNDAERIAAECAGTRAVPVVNEDWPLGIGGSIRAGVRAISNFQFQIDSLVILLCDQVYVTEMTIHRLTSEHLTSGKPVCVAAFGNSLGPPVIVGASLFEDLLALPDAHGAKEIWLNWPQIVHRVICPEAAIDIDTPGEYASLSNATP